MFKDLIHFEAKDHKKFNYIIIKDENSDDFFLYKIPKNVDLPLDKNSGVINLNT